MKRKGLFKLLFILSLLLLLPSLLAAQPTATRAYYRWKTTGMSTMGPISDCTPGAVTVEWYNNNFIQIKMGTLSTLTWRYHRKTLDGCYYYSFYNASGVVMPGTNYTEAVFSSDWGLMQINYMFGLGAFRKIPMSTIYRYLAEGDSAADEYNQDYYGR